MARIRAQRVWYEQVEPSTFSEEVFEQRVTLHAPSVYPFYHVLPFKRSVKVADALSPKGYSEVVPDLIFVAKDYSDWWICEIEMGYHNFRSHVKPQIEKLLEAYYGEDEVDYVCKKYSDIERVRLLELVRRVEPRVIVIVNQHVPKWLSGWDGRNVVFAVFELFTSSDGDDVFRVNGEYPYYLKCKISSCSFHPIVPRLLTIDQPDKLNLPQGQRVKLLYNNCLTEWRRIDEGDEVYLTSEGRNPLKPKCKYSIYERNDGLLILCPEALGESEDEE